MQSSGGVLQENYSVIYNCSIIEKLFYYFAEYLWTATSGKFFLKRLFLVFTFFFFRFWKTFFQQKELGKRNRTKWK